MRPSHVTPPAGWREQIALEEGLLAIAPHLPVWTGQLLPDWGGQLGRFLSTFPRQQPLAIEYCSGNGTWIAAQAKACPQLNWIAVERRFDRVRQIRSKIANAGLSNLMVVWGEAQTFTTHFLEDQSVGAIYINFPDPWPKKKHAKKRIMLPDFITDLQRVLCPGGTLTFVTDDAPFAESTRELLRVEQGLDNLFPVLGYTDTWENYGGSTFEELWRSKGKSIFYHRWKRRDFSTQREEVQ